MLIHLNTLEKKYSYIAYHKTYNGNCQYNNKSKSKSKSRSKYKSKYNPNC